MPHLIIVLIRRDIAESEQALDPCAERIRLPCNVVQNYVQFNRWPSTATWSNVSPLLVELVIIVIRVNEVSFEADGGGVLGKRPSGRVTLCVQAQSLSRVRAGDAIDPRGNNMNILTFSEARAGFKQALDTVCRDHEPTIITRQRGEHVVMISLEDYCSMQETLHLLGTPANADRLRQSIAQFKSGKTVVKELLSHDAKEEGEKQGRGSE